MSNKIEAILKAIHYEFELGTKLIKYGFWLGCGVYMGFTIMLIIHPTVYQWVNK